MRSFMRRIGILLAVIAPVTVQAADLPDPWVQFDNEGRLSVRAIVAPGAECPKLVADGKPVMGSVRSTPNEAYPIQVCAGVVPAVTKKLTVAGLPAPVLPRQVNRIVVVGDTGCRLKGSAVQDCNDPVAWPWATVARRAAAQKPDLVIHVGDYHYRESPCPEGQPGCAGSPWGDNWAVWKRDMLDPAAPLLAAAPWVLVRGNHELCGRGGLGWFRLFDPDAAVLDCPVMTKPYALSLKGLDLLVFDSADADDDRVRKPKLPLYKAQFHDLLAGAKPHSWLLTHRPLWSHAQGNVPAGAETNATERAAIEGEVPPGLDMVMSGHVHDFATYDFGPTRPSQLVVGDSGDANDEISQRSAPGVEVGGMKLVRGMALRDYGYLVLDRRPSGWDGTLHALDDSVLARCRFLGRSIACQPAGRAAAIAAAK